MTILMEIVESFIKTEEPIGSKTLSGKSSIGVSPATIRNDMRVLEDMGFIKKPHSSAGRVPSDKGYRMYVNLSLESDISPTTAFNKIFSKQVDPKRDSLSDMLEFSSGLFAQMTNYTTVIIAPVMEFKSIKHLNLSRFEEDKIIAVFIDIDDTTETRVIYYEGFSDYDEIRDYNNFISSVLLYKTMEELKDIYHNLEADYPHFDFSKILIELAIDFLNKDRQLNVHSSGLANLVRFGENEGYDIVRSIIEFMEDDNNLIKLWSDQEEDKKINIKIGTENEEEVLQHASIISAKYDIFDGDFGSINIIGPTHMDYRYVLEAILGLSNTLSSLNKMIKR